MSFFLMRRIFFYFCILFSVTFIIAYFHAHKAETKLGDEPKVPDYTIGVEDVLTIFVWKEEDLNWKVTVRPDGKISFPLVNDVVAEGLTCKELADKIRQKLLIYIKDPNITVVVDEINSFKVYVLGEVNKQGVYSLKSPVRLLQILAMSEGLNEYANKSEIVIIRKESTKEKRMKVDYKKIISGEKPDENIYIRPGDIIIVK